jgi:hypothetical protein
LFRVRLFGSGVYATGGGRTTRCLVNWIVQAIATSPIGRGRGPGGIRGFFVARRTAAIVTARLVVGTCSSAPHRARGATDLVIIRRRTALRGPPVFTDVQRVV